MARIVQKYGGTSVGDIARIKRVADRIKATRDEGNEVVVVVSARSGVTNELLARAKAIYPVDIKEDKIAGVRVDVIKPRDGVAAANQNPEKPPTRHRARPAKRPPIMTSRSRTA